MNPTYQVLIYVCGTVDKRLTKAAADVLRFVMLLYHNGSINRNDAIIRIQIQ